MNNDPNAKFGVGNIELKIEGVTREEIEKYQEILTILITCGALRLKNGKAMLHFDSEGTFQGVELDYWPFKRKTQKGENHVQRN